MLQLTEADPGDFNDCHTLTNEETEQENASSSVWEVALV